MRNALTAAYPKRTASRTLCYSVLLLLEADYSNDDSVVRAIWSAGNGLGPGFENEFLEDRFVVKLVSPGPNRTHLLAPALNRTGSSWIVVLIPWAMVFGRSLLSAGVALASWLATPAPGPRRSFSLAQSPTEANRSLPGDLLWSLDAFAPAPLDSAIPASVSVLPPLAATSHALVKGAAGASRALSVSPSSSLSSTSSTHCASPAPDSLASPGPRPEDHGFCPTAFRRPRTVSAYQLAAQGYTGPMRREAKTPLRLRQRYNGNWASMWPRPATPQGQDQGDSTTLSGLNLPRPAAQPTRARKSAPAPRPLAPTANKENVTRSSTTPLAPPPSRRTAAPLRARNGNVAPANGRVTANFTGDSMDDTLVPGACTPRAATVTTGKAPRSRVRMAPPPAIPLAPFGPGSTTPTATPTVRAPLLSAMRSSSPSAPLALSSTPVRSAPYSKRRMSPPPPLASAPRAGPSTQTGPASVMASTPPRPRQDKGKARAVSSPPSLPSQEFAVGDETVMANGDDDNDGDDTVRTEDVELSTEVLAGLGMYKFPGLTLVQPRAGHTTGRLCLPSLGLPPCVVTRKAAPKAAKAKTPRTVTILSPPTWSAPAGSRAPATPGPAPLDLGKSIRAGASVRARATAMEELAAVSGTTISAPAPVSSSAAPSQAVRTPSAARVTSATAPAKTYTRASDHMIELLDEMDRQHELARQMGLPPPGCRPATQSAADFGPGDITARLERQAHIRRYGSGPSDDSDSFDSFESFRSSGTSSSSGKKRPATEFDWMHADVAPLDESLVQAFKKQRQLAPRRVFGRQDSLDRLASRQTSGSPIRLDAPRRRPAAVALRGATAVGPRLPPIVRPITVVKVNGVVVMDLVVESPASRSFVHPANVSLPPAHVDASATDAPVDTSSSADNCFASSSGSSLSFAARSFSLEAAKRSAKVKEAGRRRMAEVKLAISQ